MSRKKSRFSYAIQPEVTGKLAKPEVLAQLIQLADPAQPGGGAAHALKEPEAYALPPQRKGKPAVAGVVRRTDLPREQLNVRIRPELKRAAAAVAALEGVTLGDVVEAALIDYIKQSQGQPE